MYQAFALVLVTLSLLTKLSFSIKLDKKTSIVLPSNTPAINDYEKIFMTFNDKYFIHVTNFNGLDQIDLRVYTIATGANQTFDETDFLEDTRNDEILAVNIDPKTHKFITYTYNYIDDQYEITYYTLPNMGVDDLKIIHDDFTSDPDFDISHIFLKTDGKVAYLVSSTDPVITAYDFDLQDAQVYDFADDCNFVYSNPDYHYNYKKDNFMIQENEDVCVYDIKNTRFFKKDYQNVSGSTSFDDFYHGQNNQLITKADYGVYLYDYYMNFAENFKYNLGTDNDFGMLHTSPYDPRYLVTNLNIGNYNSTALVLDVKFTCKYTQTKTDEYDLNEIKNVLVTPGNKFILVFTNTVIDVYSISSTGNLKMSDCDNNEGVYSTEDYEKFGGSSVMTVSFFILAFAVISMIAI